MVLDTNVLISAYRFGGKPDAILELVHGRSFVSLTSQPLKDELVRVLTEKFFAAPDSIAETCALLWEISEWIVPRHRLSLCPDEADNRVLECALEGHADFIVTGDRHLLSLPPIEGLAILTPDAFLARFSATGGPA